ncbi:hypothetical protein OGATHE_002110 [Ogataea polymorpha]|uniref:Uncharacterized protein n=1 Tax=Ogataea polymorpha TaxID=460523 RepID=A0A9P8PMB6_9ASCO|nr:hypothetical protein OGATHE_002110 [Ogataea polymorpha]
MTLVDSLLLNRSVLSFVASRLQTDLPLFNIWIESPEISAAKESRPPSGLIAAVNAGLDILMSTQFSENLESVTFKVIIGIRAFMLTFWKFVACFFVK